MDKSHCVVKAITSFLLNGEPLSVETYATVPSIAKMSDKMAIIVLA